MNKVKVLLCFLVILVLNIGILISCTSISKENINSNNLDIEEITPTEASVKDIIGTCVRFGNYFKDDDINLKPLLWDVVEVKESKVFLITTHIIDCEPFLVADTQKNSDTYWTHSNIREWLNNEFYNTAFSNNEKNMILYEYLKILNHSRYEGGREAEFSKDYVFLMTAQQAENAPSYILRAVATKHAKSKGVFFDPNDYAIWWLMSPGFYSHAASCVDIYGNIQNGSLKNSFTDTPMDANYCGVRPMIAVDYDAFMEIYDEIKTDVIYN